MLDLRGNGPNAKNLRWLNGSEFSFMFRMTTWRQTRTVRSYTGQMSTGLRACSHIDPPSNQQQTDSLIREPDSSGKTLGGVSESTSERFESNEQPKTTISERTPTYSPARRMLPTPEPFEHRSGSFLSEQFSKLKPSAWQGQRTPRHISLQCLLDQITITLCTL